MKKLFKISFGAMLAALPMMAGAAVTGQEAPDQLPSDPSDALISSVTATNSPKYATKSISSADRTQTVTAGYVKGAYNAAIKGINKLDSERQAISESIDSYATRDGAVATIKAASATGVGVSITDIDVETSGVSTSALNVNAPITASVTPYDTWDSDHEGATQEATIAYSKSVNSPTVAVASATDVSGTASTTMTLNVTDSSVSYHQAPAANTTNG